MPRRLKPAATRRAGRKLLTNFGKERNGKSGFFDSAVARVGAAAVRDGQGAAQGGRVGRGGGQGRRGGGGDRQPRGTADPGRGRGAGAGAAGAVHRRGRRGGGDTEHQDLGRIRGAARVCAGVSGAADAGRGDRESGRGGGTAAREVAGETGRSARRLKPAATG